MRQLFCSAGMRRAALFLFRDDLDPVAVRIADEVDAHALILKADAAHVTVALMRGGIIVHLAGEMDFILAQIICALMVAQPGELDFVPARAVAEEDEDKAAVGRFVAAQLGKAERLFIERKAPVKIAIEAAIRQGWDYFIGSDGAFVGMHSFGASAPAKDLFKHFGITAEAVVAAVEAKLA